MSDIKKIDFDSQHKNDIKDALLGKNQNVYTIAIVSFEKTSNLNDSLEKLLYTGNINYTKINNSDKDYLYIIYNIFSNFMTNHMRDYNQNSFVFITKLENNCLNMEYFVKSLENKKISYVNKYSKENIKEPTEVAEFFSKLSSDGWQIPFDFNTDNFFSENATIEENQFLISPFIRLSRIHTDAERDFIKQFTAGKLVGMSNYYRQCSLYRDKKSVLINLSEYKESEDLKHKEKFASNIDVNMCLIVPSCTKTFTVEQEVDLNRIYTLLSGLEFKNKTLNKKQHCIRVVDIYDDVVTFTEKMCYLASKYNNLDIIIKPKGFPPRDIHMQNHNSYEIWNQYRMLAESVFKISKKELQKLYGVPYSRLGRDYCCYPEAHCAYLSRKNMGLPEFPRGFHPYGPTWTAQEAEKHGWENPLKNKTNK